MKKIAMMSALALCLGFTSCDNYEEPNPPAQSNPQTAVLEANGIVLKAGSSVADEAGNKTVVNLAEYNNENKGVAVAAIDFTSEFPAGYDLKMVMEMSKTADFAKVMEVPTTYADGVVTAAPDAIQGAIVALMGKSPAEKTAYARFAAYAVNGTSVARIGDPTLYYGPVEMQILPIPSDFVIEDMYYLLGTVNGWSVATALPFTHSDANPYDDPVFTIAVNITADEAAAGWWWKIVPQSTFETGNWVDGKDASFGVEENGDESTEGILVGRTADSDCGAGCMTVDGTYILTINMEEMTYEFSEAVPNLWTPGPANSWTFTDPRMMLLGTTDYTNYTGYVYVEGEVKFTSEPAWTAKYNLGAGDEEGTLANGSNSNIAVAQNGLYYIQVNLPNLTYKMDLVSTIGVIGDATPNGWDASTALTPDATFSTWTGDVVFKGGEFKFRANDAWDINLGGELTNLVQNGSNLPSPGDGTYTVTLDLTQLPYMCTLVKK